MRKKTIIPILLTPVFILMNYYITFFAHEYGHSITAWLFGYMKHPLDIHYGSSNWQNILFLSEVNENVNYSEVFSQNHGIQAALIAFAGLGVNIVLYVSTLLLLKNKNLNKKPYWFTLLFWLNFMNLGNFYCYIPIRTFSPQDDIANIVKGLDISPWPIYIIFGYIVVYLIIHFFRKTLVSAYHHLSLRSTPAKASLMFACVFILFGYFGMAGFGYAGSGEISHFLSLTSLIMVPGLCAVFWPRSVR